MPGPTPVRAVVVSWNGAHLLPSCLDSLLAQTVADRIQVVVVDNASEDGTAELVRERYPDVRLVRSDRNLGFAGGAALGTADVDDEHVALLNNDATFAPDAVERMAAVLDGPDGARVGAVTAKILLDADSPAARGASAVLVNSTGNVVRRDGTGTDRDWLRPDGTESTDPDVFGFSGGAALLRARALQEAGGFDAGLFLYYEDTDLSWRLRAHGWTVRYEAGAVARHRHATSTGVRSPVFRYFNTRNSLVVFGRHAPVSVVAASFVRQCLGLVRAALRQGPTHPAVRARARALVAVVGRTPRTLAERRSMWRGTAVSRAEVSRYLSRVATTDTP